MAQSSLFSWGFEDEKEKLQNPIITYFTTVCSCGCADRKNEMGAVPCGCGSAEGAAPHRPQAVRTSLSCIFRFLYYLCIRNFGSLSQCCFSTSYGPRDEVLSQTSLFRVDAGIIHFDIRTCSYPKLYLHLL